MTGSKERTSRHLGVSFLKKILAMIGCFFLFFSTIFPFYHTIRYSQLAQRVSSIDFWSFKSEIHHYASNTFLLDSPYRFEQFWFIDYWSNNYYGYLLISGFPWIFVSMFLAQIIALVAGTVSVFVNRRAFAAAPAVLCPTVVILMIYSTLGLEGNLWNSYKPGYWLTYPSIPMFLLSFILSLAIKRNSKKIDNTPTHT